MQESAWSLQIVAEKLPGDIPLIETMTAVSMHLYICELAIMATIGQDDLPPAGFPHAETLVLENDSDSGELGRLALGDVLTVLADKHEHPIVRQACGAEKKPVDFDAAA
jgi:hypothetical protein